MLRGILKASLGSRSTLKTTGVYSLVFKSNYATSGSIILNENQVKSLGTDKTIENNIQSETNRLNKTRSKFWDKAEVKFDFKLNIFEIQLDGKTIKSPLGHPLALPAQKKQLAYLIAHEWSNLPDSKIKTNSLPLTSIAARSIDLININKEENVNEEAIAKIGSLTDIKLNLLNYLDTDTCLVFAGFHEYHGSFRKKQDELYLPLIEEFEQYFNKYAEMKKGALTLVEKVKLQYIDTEVDGLRGNTQSPNVRGIVFHWLSSLPIYDLIALEKAVLMSKSFLCGATLLRSNCSDPELMKNLYQINKRSVDEYFFRSVDEIIEMGNLETIFQTNEWGEVEDTHDVDKVDWIRSLTSAALLSH